MGLKENIDAVKKEIGTEEKFLESVIKGERFFKRYKSYVIIAVVAIIIAVSAYLIMDTMNKNRLQASNEAYAKLLNNPSDKEALQTLKEKNERLYKFFTFQQALENSDKEKLETLISYNQDPVISDLAAYQTNSKEKESELLAGFEVLEEGYALLKEGKTKEAKTQFSQIPMNSPLQDIVQNLQHYQGIK